MAPELKLMFQLGGSALMLHMTNTMFKSAMPNMDDILRQNPDLMHSFQQAAVNSMAGSNPGFSGFVNGMMSGNGGGGGGSGSASTSNGRGPPPPMRTNDTQSVYENRGGNNSFGQFKQNVAPPTYQEDNIRFQETPRGQQPPQQQQVQQPTPRGGGGGANSVEKSSRKPRQEMKGPSDIDEVLSKLKTKSINIQQQPQQSSQRQQNSSKEFDYPDNNSSTISINDMREMGGNGLNMPKRSKRKPTSEKSMASMNLNI